MHIYIYIYYLYSYAYLYLCIYSFSYIILNYIGINSHIFFHKTSFIIQNPSILISQKFSKTILNFTFLYKNHHFTIHYGPVLYVTNRTENNKKKKNTMGKTLTFSPKYAPDLYTEIPRDPIQEQLTIDRFNDGVPDSRRGRPPVGDPSSPQHFLHRRAPEQGCPAVSQW